MNKKKVLIITYYWPPAGGPGVQRWLKFTKYLPEFGYEPYVYTPENPSYPLLDPSLEKQVPKELTLVQTKIWEPYQLAELLSSSNQKYKAGQFDKVENQSLKGRLSIWVRGNFFIPDARKFWVKPSLRFLKTYLKKNSIDTVITSGPPHSMHLIGLGLKKEDPSLKWIADFRDPWTEISYYKHLKLSKWADRRHHALEKEVLQTADLTLATSYSDAEQFKSLGANAICITNGFDPSDLPAISNDSPKSDSKFSLSYIGVLEQLRNPQLLWDVLIELVESEKAWKEKLELRFVGRIDPKLLESLQSSPLSPHLKELGYLSHEEALAQMQKASLLLITNFPSSASKGIIPGKLFEYLASEKRILSFGPPSADVQKILEETKSGSHFAYDESSALKEFLKKEMDLFESGEKKQGSASIEKFTRRSLTKSLVSALERLIP
ncbi:glycosyltransferase family protein [Chryseobacterium sp. A321]